MAEKSHPKSLGNLFRVIRKAVRGCSQKQFHQLMASIPTNYDPEFPASGSVSAWERADPDGGHMIYPHLERYAHSAMMPVGVMLILSRISADISAAYTRKIAGTDERLYELEDVREMMGGLARLVLYYNENEQEMLASSESSHISSKQLENLYQAYKGKSISQMRSVFEVGYPSKPRLPDPEKVELAEAQLKRQTAKNGLDSVPSEELQFELEPEFDWSE